MKYKQFHTKFAGFGTRIAQSRLAKHCHPWLARVPRPAATAPALLYLLHPCSRAAHGLDWAIPVPNPIFSLF